MKHRRTLLSAVAIAATAAVVAVGGAAYADSLVVDGDTVTAGTQTSIDFGTVECGTTVSKAVALSITRQSGGNVFADGAHVGFTAATGNTSLTVDPIAELTIPQGWGGSVKDTTTGPVTATVTLSAATAGTVQNAQVTFTASGANTKNGTYHDEREDQILLERLRVRRIDGYPNRHDDGDRLPHLGRVHG